VPVPSAVMVKLKLSYLLMEFNNLIQLWPNE